ncbi:S-adenosyl-L-methionine-dependent methyltransferase [Apodospora peruviana]|uniref:S-adenosyl-L-methionine-dependent methyltransferase n=1 Tax=Apodospora peruviana TaxID=516989 RepID=A0AAE0HWZ2_9PEZI|nr:S-adenosyl-L-methionine-dependent methyltransferase [Apodospora peruviana]
MADSAPSPSAAAASSSASAPATTEFTPASPAAAAAASPDPAPGIAVDPRFHHDEDDADSALGDENALSTTSINSTIFEYRNLHGRTYHNFGGGEKAEYWAPNDDTQNEQLDINHHLLSLTLGNKLYLAPLSNPKKVLDIGTGTGIWAIDFADEFPDAAVTGIDLSPIQPSWVPPNCSFELDDASKEWTYPDNTFDYIHIRYMIGSFKDWQSVYREAYRCLKPGGWLEHFECSSSVLCDDGSIPEDSIFSEWKRVFHEAGEKLGQTFEVIDDDRYVGWMKEAGFKDVQSRTFKTPVGSWPADKTMKEIGQFNRLGLEMGIEGFGLYVLTHIMGWSYEEVQVFMAKVRAGLRNKKWHAYCVWGAAWTQKPLE